MRIRYLLLCLFLLGFARLSASEKPDFGAYLARFFPVFPSSRQAGEADLSDSLYEHRGDRLTQQEITEYLLKASYPHRYSNEYLCEGRFSGRSYVACIVTVQVFDVFLHYAKDDYDEVVLFTYTPEGKPIDWEIIGRKGSDHFLECRAERPAAGNPVLRTKQCLVREYEWNGQTQEASYAGTVDYCSYRIDENGVIYPEKEKRTRAVFDCSEEFGFRMSIRTEQPFP